MCCIIRATEMYSFNKDLQVLGKIIRNEKKLGVESFKTILILWISVDLKKDYCYCLLLTISQPTVFIFINFCRRRLPVMFNNDVY